ncbi:ABC transporter substrate-binding protein [uncultured Clostridium sp.]|uniref:ABC transporter substrate-binding protein n=1 Tax=uncultured Clostridium sp. TaxID=59620 RepID=UPI0025F8A61D|nr:ABC transporter substrate-binding protein [uncultured Clostridium sp.]
MKRKSLILSLIVSMSLLITGCNNAKETNVGDNSKDKNSISTTADTAGSSSKDSITVYVGNNIFESSLDPVKGAMSYGYSFTNNALTRVNPNSEYEGDLAESWNISEDSLTYTFNLKKDIKFHDGSDFTSEDVVFTYETVKNNQADNENVDLTRLKDVEAIDDYTVKFTLSEPYSPFFDSIALLGIVPSDAYDSEDFDKSPIGTGPWKVVQYNTDQQIIVQAYENYYEGTPKIKQVTFVKMDSKSAFSNAKSGQLDIVMVDPNYSTETIDGMHLENLETMDVRNISLPCLPEQTMTDKDGNEITVGNNVTSDIAVRKALSIGINREQIIENALNGVGKKATGFTTNLSWGNPLVYDDNQKEEAEKILEEAGWIDSNGDGIREKDGVVCEFDVYTSSNDEQRYLLGSAVAEDAKELGIKINVKQGTWDELTVKARTCGIVWGWGQYSPTVLRSLLYSDLFLSGGYDNTIGYSNEQVDKLINEAIDSNNQEEAIEKWKEVQTVSSEDYPYLYIVNIEHSYFVNDSLDISIDTQIPHPHGHGAPIICNMKDWKINE